ncbi:hypothetical protein E6O75_ATG10667 [Venturia nashicola]|uniref:Malate dehydrogenase n=1 Tax=Venturia nashicola TaxID=86259 RepID=A0A4Z1NX39_9PEZI|nr:hypothetical protein E6O75_ATG10667 [Venturia nashicola]
MILVRISIAMLATFLTPIFATAAAVDTRESKVLSTFEKRFAEASANLLVPRKEGDVAASCDLANVNMPNTSPIALPPPSAGLSLTHIAIGRGTQNYTCANDTANPVASGALATLFNVTCLAGPYPTLLALLPDIALKFPTPDPSSAMSPANLFLSGHHFFTDLTTPFFNFNTNAHEWGTVGCKKANATDAPNKAADVPWLKLSSKSRDGCTISEVYRLNTKGGQPPATCKGMGSTFTVQYAAEYWFWSNPDAPAYT